MNTATNTKKRSPGKPSPRSNSTRNATQNTWKRVSFASDCGTDDNGEPLEECGLCGDSYADCECPVRPRTTMSIESSKASSTPARRALGVIFH